MDAERIGLRTPLILRSGPRTIGGEEPAAKLFEVLTELTAITHYGGSIQRIDYEPEAVRGSERFEWQWSTCLWDAIPWAGAVQSESGIERLAAVLRDSGFTGDVEGRVRALVEERTSGRDLGAVERLMFSNDATESQP